MRILTTILISLILSGTSYGQARTLYIDLCENFTSEENYDVKRVVVNHPEKKFQYIIYDYYKNGQLLTTGLTKSKNGKVKDGEFTYYHPNGKKMAHGIVKKDFKMDYWTYWDTTGVEISKDTLIRRAKTISIANDSVFSMGKCLCYFRESTWIRKNTVTNKISEYEYLDGDEIASNGLYKVTDDTAMYKAGVKELYKYIARELKYPFITWLKGKHGKVFVRFIIDKNGNLLNPTFLASLDKPTEKKIRKVLLATSGKWNPATYKGKSVSSALILPVAFELK
jgi:protein TonB